MSWILYRSSSTDTIFALLYNSSSGTLVGKNFQP
jgi:hypothetical protein